MERNLPSRHISRTSNYTGSSRSSITDMTTNFITPILMEKGWKKERDCCVCETIRGIGQGRVRLYGCKFCGHAVCTNCSPTKVFHGTTQKPERICIQCLEIQREEEAIYISLEEQSMEVSSLRIEIKKEQEAREQAEMKLLMALEDFNQIRIRDKDRIISHVPGSTKDAQTYGNTQDQCVDVHPSTKIGTVQACQDFVHVETQTSRVVSVYAETQVPKLILTNAETQAIETSVSLVETQAPVVDCRIKSVQTDLFPTLDIEKTVNVLIPSVSMDCFQKESAVQTDADFVTTVRDVGFNTEERKLTCSSSQVDVFPPTALRELVKLPSFSTFEKETETDFFQALELRIESSGMSEIPAVSPRFCIKENEQIPQSQEKMIHMSIDQTASLSILQIRPFQSLKTHHSKHVPKPILIFKTTPKSLILEESESPMTILTSESTENCFSSASKSDVSWRNKEGKFSPGIEGVEKETQTDVTERDVTAAMEEGNRQMLRIEALENEAEEYRRIIENLKTGESDTSPKDILGRLTNDEEEHISPLQFPDSGQKGRPREMHHIRKSTHSVSRSVHSMKTSQKDMTESACKCYLF